VYSTVFEQAQNATASPATV